MNSLSSATLGFFMASRAKFIVAIGVLNSWVMLLIKSVFIREIWRCRNNCDKVLL